MKPTVKKKTMKLGCPACKKEAEGTLMSATSEKDKARRTAFRVTIECGECVYKERSSKSTVIQHGA